MSAYYSLMRRVPRPMIEAAYRGLEAADNVTLAFRNLRHRDFPLPPMRIRARVGSRGADAFLRAGKSCADAFRNAARAHLKIEIADAGRILDFGCGCGRTLRHFAPAPVEGCDVDATAIAWLQQNVSMERFAANRFDPPLPWPGGTFDLVYSVSIFTHLNETSQLEWLRELARVLKPGGGALLTVHSEHALSMFLNDTIYSTASMKSRLAAHDSLDGFIFEPYETSAGTGITREYGLTFHNRTYIERVWGELFDVCGIDVGTVDGLQDVVALRRRL